MANTGKSIATLLIGAAVGAAVGYIVAMGDDRRKESIEKIKDSLSDIKDNLKDKVTRKKADLEDEIYNN